MPFGAFYNVGMPMKSCFSRRLLHGLGALILWLAALLPAQAQDHITQRTWLEDTSGQQSWHEVQQQATQPYTGLLSRGLGNSAIWIKLRIDPSVHPAPAYAENRLVLRIRPVYLDDIEVYDPLAPAGLVGTTGDTHHPRNDEFQGLDFLVPIERGTQARDIWLRVRSSSTRQIDVQALNIHDLNRNTYGQSLVFSGYVGLVLVLAVWGIVHWLFSREHLIGIFSVKQLAALMFALSSLGHLRALWPVAWPAWLLDRTSTVFGVAAVSAAVWFHVRLISEFDPPAWVRRVHQVLLALLPLKLALLLAGWTTPALRLNMTEVLVNPLFFLVSVILAHGWRPDAQRPATLPRWLVLGFYMLLVGLLMLAALPALGLISGSEIGLYIVQVHGLVTAFLVLLLLQYRAHVMHQQQQQVALALERSQLQVQQERDIRSEQENLLAMLAHELKTPLATMHMRLDANASGSREIKQAIRDMNGVIERCQQTLQLSDQQLVPHAEVLDMVDLVRDAVSACAQPQRVQLDMPAQLSLRTDRQLCAIVLNNLLENACKYASPDSPIRLRLGTTTDADGKALMQLEVANLPGQGSWPEADKIFDKYYRSPQARRQAGTGLGLYLVRNLMQVMGGRIRYVPTAQEVRFVCQLPLLPASAT